MSTDAWSADVRDRRPDLQGGRAHWGFGARPSAAESGWVAGGASAARTGPQRCHRCSPAARHINVPAREDADVRSRRAQRLGAATGPSYPCERAALSVCAPNGPKRAMGRALSSREPRPLIESRAECGTGQQAIASSSHRTFRTAAPRRGGSRRPRSGAASRRRPPRPAGAVVRGARLVRLVPSLARRRPPPWPSGSAPGPVNGGRGRTGHTCAPGWR